MATGERVGRRTMMAELTMTETCGSNPRTMPHSMIVHERTMSGAVREVAAPKSRRIVDATVMTEEPCRPATIETAMCRHRSLVNASHPGSTHVHSAGSSVAHVHPAHVVATHMAAPLEAAHVSTAHMHGAATHVHSATAKVASSAAEVPSTSVAASTSMASAAAVAATSTVRQYRVCRPQSECRHQYDTGQNRSDDLHDSPRRAKFLGRSHARLDRFNDMHCLVAGRNENRDVNENVRERTNYLSDLPNS